MREATAETILAALPRVTVGLVGDLFLDRYFVIDPALDEPSVETGLTAYQVVEVRSQPGALGTVINNLAALGVGRIVPVSLIGDDGEGYELRRALADIPAVDTRHVGNRSAGRTPTYVKPMRGGVELNRLDTKNRTPTPARDEDQVIASLRTSFGDIGVWIVLDQVSEANCGVVTDRVLDELHRLAARPAKFILADSRGRASSMAGLSRKPNMAEAGGLFPGCTWDELLAAQPVTSPVFVTGAERGTILLRPDLPPVLVPAYPVAGPIDPCGAGDSCSAGIACAVAAGCDLEDAARFGNLVASITVQQLGTTGTASPEQVRARVREVNG